MFLLLLCRFFASTPFASLPLGTCSTTCPLPRFSTLRSVFLLRRPSTTFTLTLHIWHPSTRRFLRISIGFGCVIIHLTFIWFGSSESAVSDSSSIQPLVVSVASIPDYLLLFGFDPIFGWLWLWLFIFAPLVQSLLIGRSPICCFSCLSWHELDSVEYECIMAVFTLSLWTAQVRAISVNSTKGNCPKLVTI